MVQGPRVRCLPLPRPSMVWVPGSAALPSPALDGMGPRILVFSKAHCLLHCVSMLCALHTVCFIALDGGGASAP